MRLLYLPVVAAIGIAACGSPPPAQQDPNAPALEPAVISVPSTVRLSVSAPAETRKSTIIPSDPAQRMIPVSQGYSLAAATMVFQDAKMLGQLYHVGAVLRTPDSTVSGSTAVVRQLLTLARTKSLAEFERTSQGIRIIDDSTFVDSGTYVMVLTRSPKDSVRERGKYAAMWRARTDITKWVILEDHIQPGKSARK